MENKKKNMCKKHETKIDESERAPNFLKEGNLKSNLKENQEEYCSDHPQIGEPAGLDHDISSSELSVSGFNNEEFKKNSMRINDVFPIKKSLKALFFEFFNEHEPVLEFQGKYIDWDYFQKLAGDELKKIKRKTFDGYRFSWFQGEYGISFSDHIKKRNLKPYSWKKKNKYSSLGPQPVDLDKIFQFLINKEVKWVRKYDFQEISNGAFDGTRTPREFKKIYNNRQLHRWLGFIYVLFQKLDINGKLIEYQIENGHFITSGKFIIGFSTKRWSDRWYHYKKDALEYYKPQIIHQLIRDLNNAGVNVDDAFGHKILEFCWTDSKLRTREDEWIDELDAKNPLIGGCNTASGGSGGSKVSIPRSIFIPYIASGLWQEEIRQSIIKDHKITLTPDVVRQRIIDYWGSMSEARKMFLKPILRVLLKHGYSSEYLGTYVFNRSRRTISNWCQEFWEMTFEEKRNECLKSYLRDLIIEGLEYREIDEKVKGMPWSTINDQIIKWWGRLKLAREELMKPMIAEALSAFLEPLQIAEELGHEDTERVRKFIHIFWNFPNSIRGDWTLVDKFRSYIKKNRLSKEEIMQLSDEDIRNIFNLK